MTQPNPGYSFELCSADDPKRTYFYCGTVACWWPLDERHKPGDHIAITDRSSCGQFWRKPVEIPEHLKREGWEMIPESELDSVCPESDEVLFLNDSGKWIPKQNRRNQSLGQWRRDYPEGYPAFIRRKSQPVSAVESGAEVQPPKFWMVMRLSNSSATLQQVDSLPHKKHATKEEAESVAKLMADRYPNAKGFIVLESCALFKPVKKTAAEKAWEEVKARDFNSWPKDEHRDALLKEGFLAGYAKGAAK